jgi:hypothetical protein
MQRPSAARDWVSRVVNLASFAMLLFGAKMVIFTL